MSTAMIFDLGNVFVRINNRRTIPHIQKFLKDPVEAKALERMIYYGYHEPANETETALRDVHNRFHKGRITRYGFYNYLRKHLEFTGEFTYDRFELIWPARFERNEAAIAILKALKAYRRYLLSDANEVDTAYLKKHHGDIYAEFDDVFLSHLTGVQKQSRRAWEVVLEKIGTPPGECLFVDDRPDYVRQATELGMRGIVFVDAEHLGRDLVVQGCRLDYREVSS
jgi:HAD superfamily hydrolase (TIGR01509 family)